MTSVVETERFPYFTQISAFNFRHYPEELALPLVSVAIDDEPESYVARVGRLVSALGERYKGYVALV